MNYSITPISHFIILILFLYITQSQNPQLLIDNQYHTINPQPQAINSQSFQQNNIKQINSNQPLPLTYTNASVIVINETLPPQQVIYSYDQTTLIYRNLAKTKCFIYQVGLLQQQSKTQICMTSQIKYIKYSPKMDKIYLLTHYIYEQTYNIGIYYAKINKDYPDRLYFGSLCSITRLNITRVKWQVSYNNRIAIATYGKVYIVSDINGAYNFVNITIKQQVSDLRWHPQDKDILILGCCQYQNNSIIVYNYTSDDSRQYRNTSTQKINIFMNGNIVLSKSYKKNDQGQQLIDVYKYQNGQLTYIQTFNGYYLANQDMSSKQNNIMTLIKQIQSTKQIQIQLFQISYQSINNNNILNTNINQQINTNLSNKQLNTNLSNKQNQFNLSNIQNQLNLSKQISNLQSIYSFKLISSIKINFTNYNSSFDGIMSLDGNQIYIRIPYIYVIQRWARCSDGMYQSKGQCLKCADNCQTCHINQSKCMSCAKQDQYWNQQCFNCNIKYPGCQNCTIQGCYTCRQDQNYNKYPLSGKCSCKQGAFAYNETKCLKCSDALQTCVLCSDGNTCTKCEGGFSSWLDPQTNRCTYKRSIILIIVIGSVVLIVIILIIVLRILYKRRKMGKQKRQNKQYKRQNKQYTRQNKQYNYEKLIDEKEQNKS